MKKKQKLTYKRSFGRIIINTFIGIFGILVFITIISFGIMQTSTFRGWLKNKVISTVDQSINGTINISNIQGTILTSVYLNNVSLTTGKDTIFSAEKVGLNANPFRILIGQIYVAKLLLVNPKINFKEISNNNWNYEILLKTGKPIGETDTTIQEKTSGFPLNLIVKNLDIINGSFSKKTMRYRNALTNYNTMNFDDIVINNFNLNASGVADISKKKFALLIKNMSALPNLNNFKLHKLKGLFEINPKFVKVDNLNIVTDSSSVNLSAELNSLNLFSSINLKDFKNYPINVSLSANPFNFSDITSFINSTDILSGSFKAKLLGDGVFGNIHIKQFTAELPNTHLELTGYLKNLHTPQKLFIHAKLVNSNAEYKDVLALLPTLDLPKFNNFKLSNFTTTFNGEPTKFRVVGSSLVDSGKINFDTFLNIQPKAMQYDAKITTANLNAFPIINYRTKLNGNINIKGSGTNPSDLNTKLKINLYNSLFQNDVIDSVNISTNAVANIIDLSLKGIINNSIADVKGKLNFSDLKNPFYDFTGKLNNLNLMPFTKNKRYKSDLNFNFYAKGKYLDIDKTIGEFKVNLDSSIFNGDSISGSFFKLQLKNDYHSRLISLYSNVADIYVNGNFKITDLASLLSYQSKILAEIVEQKISEFNPRSSINGSVALPDSISSIVNKNIHFDYSLNFKDFSLVQILLQNNQFNIAGSIKGSVQNDSNHFEISSELNLDKLVKVKGNDLVFLSGLNANVNISRDNQVNSFKNIIGALTFTGERLYTGSDFHNVNMDLAFNDSLLFYNASAKFSKNISTVLGGSLELRKSKQNIAIDTLEIDYKNTPWHNSGKIVVRVKQDSLLFNNFNFYFQNSNLNVSGFISDSTQDLSLKLRNLPLNILNYYITGISSDSLQSTINVVSNIKGTFKNPVIDISLQTNRILMKGVNVGSLICNLNYLNKRINTDLQFLSGQNVNLPVLSLEGTIPIDLTFEPIDNRTPQDKQIDLHLISKGFDLKSLGNTLPFITNQSGKLKTDISVSGTISSPSINGVLSLNKGMATVRETNLIYNISGDAKISNGSISVSNIVVANSGNSKYNGKMLVTGNIEFTDRKLSSLALSANGDLSILSNETKKVNPTLYGDLFIGTDSSVSLTYNELSDRFFVKGNIKLKNVNLTYSSPHSGFNSGQNGFNYIYVIDSSKIDTRQLDFMNFLREIGKRNKGITNKVAKDYFDYKIKLSTENDAVFTMNLAKELGQKLIANLSGSIVIDKTKEQSNAQGSFQLLEGSRLEFFKTLNATGEIRFEKNLLDPYVDVTASYLGDYVSSNDPFGKSQEVAVKIKLSGPLSELGEKFSLSDENFAVYVGRKDINSNIPNTNYDMSDALAFILIGKFKKDLTSNTSISGTGTKTSSNAASYVISPLISSFLNSALGGGNLVEDIQVSQSGRYYRVGISGKVQNFRYRIGGTTESLSDIAKANILIQYFFNKDFSIRLERRYPIIYTEGTDERVNEFGLRYKLEF